MGAIAEAANRPRAFRTLVASEPRARKIGLRIMIRVRSTVRDQPAASNPGVIAGMMTGAATRTTTPSTTRAASIRLAIVETTRQARAFSSVAKSADSTGITADDNAPA